MLAATEELLPALGPSLSRASERAVTPSYQDLSVLPELLNLLDGVANGLQLHDEVIERRKVADLDELFYSSTHQFLPGNPGPLNSVRGNHPATQAIK